MSNFVYPKNNFIFIHMPKCGGHSLRHYVFPKNNIGPFFGEIPEKYIHLPKITIVRNPYTRFVSAFNMFKYGTTSINKGGFDKGIKEIMNILFDPKINHKNPKGKEGLKHHAIPQTHPFNCYHLADHVARLENYQQEVTDMLHKIGFTGFKLVKKNSSKNKNPTIIEKENLERINEYYKQDFEQLNYPMYFNRVVVDGDKCYEQTR